MYPVPQNQKLLYHVYMCEHLAKMYLFGSEKIHKCIGEIRRTVHCYAVQVYYRYKISDLIIGGGSS